MLYVSSPFEKFPLHAQIFEVDTAGTRRFINRINLVVRGWTPGDTGTVEAVGAFRARRFSKNSQLRIELTNIDAVLRGTPELEILEDPAHTGTWQPFAFALPTFFSTEATVHTGESFVEFPFTETVSRVATAESPLGFELSQNYPNPFNPATTVDFRAHAAHASIRVYDILGRHVMTAFEGPVAAGQMHRVRIAMETIAKVGMRTLFAFEPSTRLSALRDLSLDAPWDTWRLTRRRVFVERLPYFLVAVGLWLALLAWALRRSKDWEALVLGVGLVPIAIEAASYYQVILAGYAPLWPLHRLAGVFLAAAAGLTCLAPAFTDWPDELHVTISLVVMLLVAAVTLVVGLATRPDEPIR